MIWNTAQVRSILDQVPGISFAAVTPAEDVTTEGLIYSVSGATDNLYIRGFTDQGSLPQGNDVDIPMVEVTPGHSDGGDSVETTNIIARAYVKVALIRLGFQVVNSLEPYF